MNIVEKHEFLRDIVKFSNTQINFEEILSSKYKNFLNKNSFIIDIGAHDGFHTKKFKQIAKDGRVIFFEPLEFLVDKSIISENVIYYNIALSDSIGVSEFVFADGTPQESGLKQRIYNHPDIVNPKKINVNVSTLDNIMLSFNGCDYIKIDTEGSELNIINGSIKTIQRYRPIISIEYGYPSYSVYNLSKESLWDLSLNIDYSLFDIFSNKITSKDIWMQICDLSTWDYFLVPREKSNEF